MDKKYYRLLLVALAIIALAVLSGPSTNIEDNIVAGNEFTSWNFDDQIALAETLQAIGEGKDPALESRPAKVRDYIGRLKAAAMTLREQKNRGALPSDIKDQLNQCECTRWKETEPAVRDIQVLGSDTKRRIDSDFRSRERKVVLAYIELTKNWLLKKELSMAPGGEYAPGGRLL